MTSHLVFGAKPPDPPRCTCGHKASMHRDDGLGRTLGSCATAWKDKFGGSSLRCACRRYEEKK